MVRTRVVFNLVLNKLEARQTNPIKRQVVRTAGVSDRERGRAQIAERRQPLTEERTNSFVALQVNATNLARAVIEIEIAAQLLVLGFRDERWSSSRSTVSISVSSAHPVVHAARRGRSRRRRVLQRAEVVGNVGARPEQAFLFTTAQRDPDHATRFDTD